MFLDTAIADNYIFDETLDKQELDAKKYVVEQRNITPVIDQQKGSGDYLTSQVVFDASSFGNTSDMTSWSEAYLVLPMMYELTMSTSGGNSDVTAQTYNPSLLVAIKNNSFIENIKVEQGGRVIINETQNLSHLINFVKHCTSTSESLNTQTSINQYWPDSEFSSGATANLQGVSNTSQNGFFKNEGMIKRQLALNGANLRAGFNSVANEKSEFSTYQYKPTLTSFTSGDPQTLVKCHYVAVVYLKDLHDYFSKHPLTRGVGYRISITCNQATTSISTAENANPLTTNPTQSATQLFSSSTCQPVMLTTGPNCLAGILTLTTARACNFLLTSKIDTSADARVNGCFLYVPSYTLSPESKQKILSNPIIERSPFFVNSAVYDKRTANNPINLQLFSAIPNPKALIIIPQLSIDVQTQPSQCSVFNPSPAVTDPKISLTRLQVRVNSKSVLPNNSNYAFQQFIDHSSRIFKLNGGQSNLTSGVIDLSKFTSNYRYYCFDLTQSVDESQFDVPQLITLEGFNNSTEPVDLYVYVIYELSAKFDTNKGAVEIM